MSQDLTISAGQARPSQHGLGVEGLRANIGTLIRAIGRGDLGTAQATHDLLAQHPAAERGAVRDLLDTLATPLQDGDINAARRALTTLREGGNRTQEDNSAPPPVRHERERVRDAVRNLIEALRTDEPDDARLAYAQLVELSDVEEHGLNGPFGQLLTDIGEALHAGDSADANAVFAAFARNLNPGSAVDLKA